MLSTWLPMRYQLVGTVRFFSDTLRGNYEQVFIVSNHPDHSVMHLPGRKPLGGREDKEITWVWSTVWIWGFPSTEAILESFFLPLASSNIWTALAMSGLNAVFPSAGPVILMCSIALSMSFLRQLLHLVLNSLMALAPLSGHAFLTGMHRATSASESFNLWTVGADILDECYHLRHSSTMSTKQHL